MSGSCAFRGKDQLTKAAARQRAFELNRFAFDGAQVRAYRCPAGGHWHVGHPARGRTGKGRPRAKGVW